MEIILDCPKCGSLDTRGQLDGNRKCFECLHVWNPIRYDLLKRKIVGE